MPNPGNPNLPWLIWDLRLPPTLARRIAPREVVVSARDQFGAVATHPPVPTVQIVTSATVLGGLNYWGPIVVDKTGSGGRVLFGDIVQAIYDFFQRPLTQDEARVLERDVPAAWAEMTRAFTARCREHPGLAEVEWKQGMRRVDCLGERYMFWGLWVSHNADGTFQLNLGTAPKPRGVPMPAPRR